MYAPPQVQNFPDDEDDDDEDLLMEESGFRVEAEQDAEHEEFAVDCVDTSPVERTVFVNAANYPSGRMGWRATHRVPFGGPGVQAVVVDLKDDPVPRSGI